MKSVRGVSSVLISSALLLSTCGPAQSNDVEGKQAVGKGLQPHFVEPNYESSQPRRLEESLPYDLLVQLFVLPNGALETCFISKSPIAANFGTFETQRTQSYVGFDFCAQNGGPSKGWVWSSGSENTPSAQGEVNIDSSETHVAVYFQAPFMVEVYDVLEDGSIILMDVDGITGLNDQGVLDVLNTPFQFLQV